MAAQRGPWGADAAGPTHAQVNQHRCATTKIYEDELAAPTSAFYGASHRNSSQPIKVKGLAQAGGVDRDSCYLVTGEVFAQLASNGFCFREFGHFAPRYLESRKILYTEEGVLPSWIRETVK